MDCVLTNVGGMFGVGVVFVDEKKKVKKDKKDKVATEEVTTSSFTANTGDMIQPEKVAPKIDTSK